MMVRGFTLAVLLVAGSIHAGVDVNETAAHHGQRGLLVTLDGDPAQREYPLPQLEDRLRVRFSVNADRLSLDLGSCVDVLSLTSPTLGDALELELCRQAQLVLRARLYTEVGLIISESAPIAAHWQWVEIDWDASGTLGRTRLWLNGSLSFDLADLATVGHQVDRLLWGVRSHGAAAEGSLLLDDLVVTRGFAIGPVGDIDRYGTVTALDLSELAWIAFSAAGAWYGNDVNSDGRIDAGDLSELITGLADP